MIGSKWEPISDYTTLKVGEIFECSYEVYSIIWQDNQTIEFIVKVEYDKENFAVSGQVKAKVTMNQETDRVSFKVAICHLKPGILFYPKIGFQLLGDRAKVSFQEANDQSDVNIKPKDDFAIRYYSDISTLR